MKRKNIYFISGILMILVAGLMFWNLIGSVSSLASEDSVAGALSSQDTNPSYSTPARLLIGSLSIDAEVQRVGITKGGKMGVPDNFRDAGWYKYGPVPGAPGNAVIAGHLDDAVGLPGVFKNLSKINIGDEVQTIDVLGERARFKVVRKETHPYDSVSTEKIFSSEGPAGLVLITCGGEWNQSVKQYSDRLVVFAEPAG